MPPKDDDSIDQRAVERQSSIDMSVRMIREQLYMLSTHATQMVNAITAMRMYFHTPGMFLPRSTY